MKLSCKIKRQISQVINLVIRKPPPVFELAFVYGFPIGCHWINFDKQVVRPSFQPVIESAVGILGSGLES